MNKNLHIITLNIPYPPDYGGMIDSFYRIKSLHELGIRIHLHCFEYGLPHSEELVSLCETISYYKRKSGFLRQFSRLPYIISTRKSKDLLENLKQNDYPILFDGLHSTYYLTHPDLSGRKKFVRAHNIEHRYYRSRLKLETNPLKKLYFLVESIKLRQYENVLGKVSGILSISGDDQDYFNNRYHNSAICGPSHPFYQIESLPGVGKFILYHGDLSVNENEIIATSLISGVFSKIEFPCIIAGKNPSKKLLLLAANYRNIKIISNPGTDEMTNLIHNAQIHILPSLNANGFKLKLLIALFAGRHCLVNEVTAKGSSLVSLCNIAYSDDEFVVKIKTLMQEPFTEETKDDRRKVLSEDFDNLNNAKKLIKLFSGS